jgi:glycosyltransferase involved in cell wall biosynthesis
MSVRVSVIVTSFNRPRMLRECLLSVAAARPDEVWVCDDGSDCLTAEGRPFSVHKVAGYALCYRVRYGVIANDPIPVDERMIACRQGALINRALAYASGDVCTLICDDDLMAEGWLDDLRAHWAIEPRTALVRGRWLVFADGDRPTMADPPSPMCPARKMTAGNFAWAGHLTATGKAQWPESQLNCLDDGFLRSLHRAGVDVFKSPSVGFAGWRREHPLANGNFSDGKDHLPAFRAILEAGSLEAAR